MKRIFIGNFDFEHYLSLSGKNRRSRTADNRVGFSSGSRRSALARLNDELAAVWTAVADEGDFIWSPVGIEEGFFQSLTNFGLPAVKPLSASDQARPVGLMDVAAIDVRLEACPWGWTDDVRDLSGQHGWRVAAPPQEVIREANSRRFSVELERSLGVGLDGAAVVRSVEDLLAAVARLPEGANRWVLKAEFGMSARERIFGEGRQPNAQVVNWLGSRLKDGSAAVLEPWVERIEEVSLQFTVPYSGVPLLEGVTPLLTDSAGRYLGNRFGSNVELELRWMRAVETGVRVARQLRRLGYFGPLGIDAMRYRDFDGRERIRSVQDVNARHSMGRLALGFRRVLEPGECGSWLHVRWPTEDREAPRRRFMETAGRLPPETRLIRTSPFAIGGRPVGHGTLVAVARSQVALEKVETILLSS